MSQPLLELQRLLAGRSVVAGRVVSVGGGMARVATAHGIVEVATDAGIQSGDLVSIRGGKAVRVQGKTEAMVYLV